MYTTYAHTNYFFLISDAGLVVRDPEDVDGLSLPHLQLHEDGRAVQIRTGTVFSALHPGTDAS